MEELKEKEKVALANLDKIYKLVHQGAVDYIFLGLLLKESAYWFRDLPGRNYKDVYEFAQKELNLCRTNVKYYLGVQKRFASGMQLKEEYKDYLFSQLREMYNMKDEQLAQCKPTMTINDLKALKKLGNAQDKEQWDASVNIEPIKEHYFKNNEQRENFLRDYTKWQLFHSVPELTLDFYKVKFTNGAYIIATVTEYVIAWKDNEIRNSVSYCLMRDDKNARYRPDRDSMSNIIDYIRTNKLGYYL